MQEQDPNAKFRQAQQDSEIIREARLAREHEQVLAKIEADTQVRLEKIRVGNVAARRNVFAGIVLAMIVAAMIFGVAVSCNSVVSDCVTSGGEWDGGSTDCTR